MIMKDERVRVITEILAGVKVLKLFSWEDSFISKIGIYDEKKNLIGVAKLATPVKKTEERDFTFKLKLDF